jgi:hypothetical protein
MITATRTLSTSRVHLAAGIVSALATILCFSSSAVSAYLGRHPAVANLRGATLTLESFLVIPAIALTAACGFVLSRRRQRDPAVIRKKRRTSITLANTLLILLLIAVLLERWVSVGAFHAGFRFAQAIELLVGGVNVILMGLNFRDGLLLAGRLERRSAVLAEAGSPSGSPASASRGPHRAP